MTLEAGAIEIAPIFHADQVGNLRREKETRSAPGKHAGRNFVLSGGDLIDRHLVEPGIRIRPQPGRGKQAPLDVANLRRRETSSSGRIGSNAVKGEVSLR